MFKLIYSTYRKSLKEPHPFQAEILEKAGWTLNGESWLKHHRLNQGTQCSTQLPEYNEKGLAMSCVEWRYVLCALGNKQTKCFLFHIKKHKKGLQYTELWPIVPLIQSKGLGNFLFVCLHGARGSHIEALPCLFG